MDYNPKTDIKNILESMKGSNILNFSKFVDETIDSNQIKMILQFLQKKNWMILMILKDDY